MRHGKILKFLSVAEAVAQFSPDSETKVGSVLVCNKSKNILGVGYNGFLRDADDAALPTVRPDKYEYMLHSEMNTIFNCARKGISLNDCTLFCTLSPCVNCARALLQCGVETVYFKEVHDSFLHTLRARDFNIEWVIGDGWLRMRRKM